MSNTITIDGNIYKLAKPSKAKAHTTDANIGKRVIVRTENAGVHFGVLAEHDRKTRTVVLNAARRVWYWKGAASLSQLAVDGTSSPTECKFPAEVATITVAQVIEIIPMTAKASVSLDAVPVWEA